MQFSKLLMYKVVEISGALVIMGQHDNVTRKDAVPLIIADSDTMVEYLLRYIGLREMGKSLQEAHREALKGADITERGTLDAPAH